MFLPRLEEVGDVEAAAVVGLLGHLLHIVALEVDHFGRSLQPAQPAMQFKLLLVYSSSLVGKTN